MNCLKGYTSPIEVLHDTTGDDKICEKCDNYKYENGVLICTLSMNRDIKKETN